MTARRLAPLLALALLVAGCGAASDDAATTPATPDRRPVVVAAAPATPARTTGAADPSGPAPTARQALERFATLYINWTYRTVAADRERLSRMATGDATTTMHRAAVTSGADYELQAGKVANAGAIIAITPQQGAGVDPDSWVVVTRERMSTAGTYDGLPSTYHVTIATVESVGAGWAVSHWEPQS